MTETVSETTAPDIEQLTNEVWNAAKRATDGRSVRFGYRARDSQPTPEALSTGADKSPHMRLRGRLELWAIRYLLRTGWKAEYGAHGYLCTLKDRGL